MEMIELPKFMMNLTEARIIELQAEISHLEADLQTMKAANGDLRYNIDDLIFSNQSLERGITELRLIIDRMQSADVAEQFACKLIILHPQLMPILLKEIFNADPSVYENICDLLENEHKIDAIKTFRIATNLGLREARDAIDALALMSYRLNANSETQETPQ